MRGNRIINLVLLFTAGCGGTNATSDGGADQSIPSDIAMTTSDLATPPDLGVSPDLAQSPAARGEYLVKNLLLCAGCHTTPDANGSPMMDPSFFLAGGRAFTVGNGKVYSANLTSDKTTGLGNWTVDQIKTALTKGHDDMNKPLSPIMPYALYSNLSDADATAIATYLTTLPAKSNAVPMNTVTTMAAAPPLDLTSVPHTAQNDPSFAAGERGRYLANLGCLSCHTAAKPMSSAPDLTRAYAGGKPNRQGMLTVYSSNLTPDATGLAGWGAMDIAATLKTGIEKGSGRALCPAMPKYAGLTDGDDGDVGAYLHSLPAIANGPYGCTDGGAPYPGPATDGGITDGAPAGG